MELKKILSIFLIATTSCFAMEQDPGTPLSTHGKLLPLMETPEVLSPIASFLNRHEILTSAQVCKSWAKFFNNRITILKVPINVTDIEFMQLAMRFPKITSLNLKFNNIITDSMVSQLTNLTNLDLTTNTIITNETVRQLTNLTNLSLAYNDKITDDAVRQLSGLTRLDLWDNNTITDKTLTFLKEHGALKTVISSRLKL